MSKSQAKSHPSPTDASQEVRAGSPPRHTTKPEGSGASNVSSQTRTDPNTGEPNPKRGKQ